MNCPHLEIHYKAKREDDAPYYRELWECNACGVEHPEIDGFAMENRKKQ